MELLVCKILGALLLLWVNFDSGLLQQSSTPYLNLNGNLPNHSFIDLSQLERSAISCFSERPSCCTVLNNGASWVNPFGVEIGQESVRDGLTVEYGVMVIDLALRVAEGIKPMSGIYSCDARFNGANSGRNQVYVGIYSTGGKTNPNTFSRGIQYLSLYLHKLGSVSYSSYSAIV